MLRCATSGRSIKRGRPAEDARRVLEKAQMAYDLEVGQFVRAITTEPFAVTRPYRSRIQEAPEELPSDKLNNLHPPVGPFHARQATIAPTANSRAYPHRAAPAIISRSPRATSLPLLASDAWFCNQGKQHPCLCTLCARGAGHRRQPSVPSDSNWSGSAPHIARVLCE